MFAGFKDSTPIDKLMLCLMSVYGEGAVLTADLGRSLFNPRHVVRGAGGLPHS